ncbi:hypothetical protein QJS04_geneDACA014384 [Acorus gramineus]|uniref:Uncharacterized protein n=1 Tax=Acorus gramineus TaxID=55184 RepID=A0AAV9A1U1_ACOGR|nr:hypothetical protein QJS04_geneDACA014384 [Acorus gramineus]
MKVSMKKSSHPSDPNLTTIVERVITVEYLQPTMSRDLLAKFPDDSAFDFDYSQSAIWSPLIPRGGGLIASGFHDLDVRAKAAIGPIKNSRERLIKGNSKMKKNGKRDLVTKRLDFSSVSTPSKGWGKFLRAAKVHFKKQKKGSALKIKLPVCGE